MKITEKENQEINNVFMLFDNSYQVDRIETTLNITEEYAGYRLAKEMENVPNGRFWAVIITNCIERRFEIKNNRFEEIYFE